MFAPVDVGDGDRGHVVFGQCPCDTGMPVHQVDTTSVLVPVWRRA